jgi:hypothetical protein
MRQAELTLEEMLSDAIVQLVMRRDGVSEDEVRAVMSGLRRRPPTPEPEGGKHRLPNAA